MPAPLALTPLAAGLIVGGIGAASGIAKGIGSARAGKKMMLSDAERKELEELERRKRAGELGLTEKERGSIEQRFLASQAGAQRELEATALQQAAARGLGGAVSGRDIFLQEQAEAQTERQLRQNQNLAVMEADRAEAAAEQARIDSMNAQQKAAEAKRAEGIAQAVSLGLAGAGTGAQTSVGMFTQLETARIEAEAKAKNSKDVLNELDAGTGDVAETMGG